MAMALWITGLPGAGKSILTDEIKKAYPEFIILRMDELRKVLTPTPTYSEQERDIVYRSFVYIAKTLTGLNHNVIIDATGNLRKWRELARRLIPQYIEIYLRCPLSVCIERERKRLNTHEAPYNIYEKAKEGWPVPGINVAYEEPLNPELIIDTDTTSPSEALMVIRNLIEKTQK